MRCKWTSLIHFVSSAKREPSERGHRTCIEEVMDSFKKRRFGDVMTEMTVYIMFERLASLAL